MRAIVFPGQGAQRIGMGEDLFDRYPQLIAQADEILGFSLRKLCLEDSSRLSATRYTQPALFVVCYLSYLDYEVEHGPPALVAGHSIGEFAALAAANAVEFVDALKLVNSRACTMANISGGAMAAVIGPSRNEVSSLIADFGSAALEIANENSPTQTVVAGLMADVVDFVDFCKRQSVRAVKLSVSGAFHSSHMRPAAEDFAHVLTASKFAPPRIPVISNVTGRLHDRDLRRAMAMHLYSPVLWNQAVEFMLDFGITQFVEIGPSPVLTPMINEVKASRQRRSGVTSSLVFSTNVSQNVTTNPKQFGDTMLGPLLCHDGLAEVLGWFARKRGDILLDVSNYAPHKLKQVRDALADLGIAGSRLSLYVDVGNSTAKEIPKVLECLESMGADRVVLGGVSDPFHDLRFWFDAKRGAPALRLMVLCSSLAAVRRLLKVPDWHDKVESICLDGLRWVDAGTCQQNSLNALRSLVQGCGVSVGARPARITPEESGLLRDAGAEFILSAGPYALVNETAKPAVHKLRPMMWTVPDGRLPEFGSTSALAAHAPCRELLYFLAGLYRVPPSDPGRLYRHWRELMDQLSTAALPCVVGPPPLQTSLRDVRRYIRQTMQHIYQAVLEASPVATTHYSEDIELAKKWWNDTHHPTSEKLYDWISGSQA